MLNRSWCPSARTRWACFVLGVVAMFTPSWGLAQNGDPLLGEVFQDHAVLQRNAPVPVWGTARPGATVTVEMAGVSAQANADDEGRWSAELPALSAGGPYTLEVQSSEGRTQTAADVLVGDVFLCSGQSNMVLPVRRTINASAEIRSASNERIRMMTLDLASSPVPLDTLAGTPQWELTTPENVPSWSAACYYFGRDLQQHVDVPFGLIASAWGGSKISTWMSPEALSTIDGYGESLALLRQYAEDRAAAQQAFGEQWEAWWHDATGDVAGAEPWHPETSAQWRSAPEGLGNWKAWNATDLSNHNGMVWFRATVDLTAAQARQDATLSLGAIDEVDQTWINGEVVGNTFGYGTERTYTIPASHLQDGQNVVVINVLNTYGAGGLTGEASDRALIAGSGERLLLNDWRYKKVPSSVGSPPRAPWESVGGLTTIYNAMIAPLHDYGLKAVLWYQGESDTGAPDQYLSKLQALKAQWRDQFGTNLPVLVVQLANYGEPTARPTASGWAAVRDAQRRAAQNDPNAGLAVTIDLGNKFDIHPRNKQDVGRRLARAARHVIYGENITPSGPVPAQATRDAQDVTVTFDHVNDSLVTYGGSVPTGFELCGETQESCAYVDAKIDGSRVRLQAHGKEATRVRYCWADSPICTLYDGAGLPATPFEIDISE